MNLVVAVAADEQCRSRYLLVDLDLVIARTAEDDDMFDRTAHRLLELESVALNFHLETAGVLVERDFNFVVARGTADKERDLGRVERIGRQGDVRDDQCAA